jgi:hypothetical protein
MDDSRSEYSSPTAQRGMCLLPSRALNVSENEIARAFKCVGAMVQPISFVVPRKVSGASLPDAPLLTLGTVRRLPIRPLPQRPL